jgi:hypothetical protein
VNILGALWARLRGGPTKTATGDGSDLSAIVNPGLDDPLFCRAYAAGAATGSWWHVDVRARAAVVCWAALQGRGLAGDFVECGVHRGGYARMVVDYVDFGALPDRNFFLIDTFNGIPERFLAGEAKPFETVYDDCHDEVVRTFASFSNVRIVRGIVPDVLPEVVPDRVAFLSIDLNTPAPSAAALEHFWPRLSAGAAVVLDDYAFAWFAEQRQALDEAAARIGAPILALPTGQGLMIRS